MSAITAAANPDDIGVELARVQRQRLASDIGIVVAGHLALLCLIMFLLWAPALRVRLIAWIAAVLLTTVARALWQWRARDPAMPDRVVIGGARVLVLAQGLAWGVSLALLVNVVTEQERAIVLIGFAGLLASASNTLVGDRPSMFYLLAGTYAPVLFALAVEPIERDDAVVAALIVLFTGVVLSLHRRARGALIEQLSTARALRASEDWFRSFFEESPVGKSITALDGTLLRVNRAFCSLLGYSEKELQQLSFPAITHPDDLATSREAQQALLAGVTDHREFEKRYRTKAGTWVWAHVSVGIRRPAPPQAPYYLTHVQDITARKHAEEQVRTLQGILPICASCKRIKDDRGDWQQMESYVREHSNAEFSHGVCPDCAARDWDVATPSEGS